MTNRCLYSILTLLILCSNIAEGIVNDEDSNSHFKRSLIDGNMFSGASTGVSSLGSFDPIVSYPVVSSVQQSSVQNVQNFQSIQNVQNVQNVQSVQQVPVLQQVQQVPVATGLVVLAGAGGVGGGFGGGFKRYREKYFFKTRGFGGGPGGFGGGRFKAHYSRAYTGGFAGAAGGFGAGGFGGGGAVFV